MDEEKEINGCVLYVSSCTGGGWNCKGYKDGLKWRGHVIGIQIRSSEGYTSV